MLYRSELFMGLFYTRYVLNVISHFGNISNSIYELNKYVLTSSCGKMAVTKF